MEFTGTGLLDATLWLAIGGGLGVGLLIGLERERKPAGKAGVRTFTLVSLLGTLAALLGTHVDNLWLLPAGLLAVTGMLVVSYARVGPAEDPGTTTVAAAGVAYLLGALAGHVERKVRVDCNGVAALDVCGNQESPSRQDRELHRRADGGAVRRDIGRRTDRRVVMAKGRAQQPVVPDITYGLDLLRSEVQPAHQPDVLRRAWICGASSHERFENEKCLVRRSVASAQHVFRERGDRRHLLVEALLPCEVQRNDNRDCNGHQPDDDRNRDGSFLVQAALPVGPLCTPGG